MVRLSIAASLLVLVLAAPVRADAPHTSTSTTATPPPPPPPPVPPAPWRDPYHQGSVAYDAGRLDEALADFTRARDLGGPPTLLYDIALTLDRLGRTREAIDTYQSYLDAVPDASNRDVVEARLAALTPSTSTSGLASHVAPPPAPILSLVTPDTHPDAVATSTTASADGAYLATHPVATADHWEEQGPEWTASWVMLALTAASVAAAVIVWNDGVGRFQALQDLCASPMGCTQTDIDSSPAHVNQDATNALIGVSAGLGAITLLTFIVEGVVTSQRMRFVRGGALREDPGPRLSVGPLGFSISGTF